MASYDAYIDARMSERVTDYENHDELMAEAQRISGLTEKTAVVREGLMALIERDSARRLARLGASEPQLKATPRRRSSAG